MAEKKIVDLVVNDNLQEAEGHLKDLTGQIKASKKDVQSLSDSFDELNQSATNVDATFEEVYGDLKPLTARMGEAEDRLYELSLAGKQGTKEFQALLTTVGNYRKTQIQTDLAVDSAATTMTQKLGGSLEYVSGAFAATQGAMAIFGKENKSVEQAILKVQSALAITQGFTAMREGANSVKQLGTAIKSLTVFQTAYNFVNNATSTGLKVLRGALIATGIGALVIGVGLLIANFDKLKAMALKLVPGLATVGKAIGGIVNKVTDFVGITSQAGRATEKMLENADKAIKKNDKFLAENASKLDEYTKRKIDANNEYNEALKKDGADQIALAKEYNRKLDKINAERDAADAAKAKGIKDAKNKSNEEEKARIKAYNDSIIEKINGFNSEVEDIEANNEQKKLELWRQRQANEINILAKNEKDKKDLLLALDKDYYAKQKVLRDASNAEDEKVFRGFEAGKAKIKVSTTLDANAMVKAAMDKSLADEKENSDRKKENARLEAEAKVANLNFYANTLNSVSALLGESTEAGKVAAIASTTISTYLAAQQAYASQLIPGDPSSVVRATIAAAVAVASGIANVNKIINTPTPGGGGAGGGGGTPTPPAAPRFNVVGTAPASANQVANTIGKDLPPVKAYVVSNDVTTAQSLDRNIISSASLG